MSPVERKRSSFSFAKRIDSSNKSQFPRTGLPNMAALFEERSRFLSQSRSSATHMWLSVECRIRNGFSMPISIVMFRSASLVFIKNMRPLFRSCRNVPQTVEFFLYFTTLRRVLSMLYIKTFCGILSLFCRNFYMSGLILYVLP